MANLRPLGSRVVIQAIAREETTKTGIYLPDTAKEKPQEGKVISVGSGTRTDKGDLTPVEVKVGERILFAKYAGTEFKLDGEEYIILSEKDILAIIEG